MMAFPPNLTSIFPRFLRATNARRIVFALPAIFLGAFVLASIDHWASPPKPVQSALVKPQNAKVSKDANGRSVIDIRWKRSEGVPIGILRVPEDFLWGSIGLLTGAFGFGPNYPDPNVIENSLQRFTLEALLPNFEPKTPENANRFKDGISGETVLIGINRAPVLGRSGLPIVESSFRIHLRDIGSEFDTRTYGTRIIEKPDRFGLKRRGPSGDFEQFRKFGYVRDIYFPDREFKDVFMVCTAEEIRDVAEDPSWPKRPLCQHIYYSSVLGARVELSYRRLWLKDWRDIQAGTEKLFQSFPFIMSGEDASP